MKGKVPRMGAEDVLIKIFETVLQDVPDRNTPEPSLHLSSCVIVFHMSVLVWETMMVNVDAYIQFSTSIVSRGGIQINILFLFFN